ncbi:30S ribosomal protein S8 [Candidatus Phytoplasma bonamiae]|uniref:Small ribosomal subunit protein uS8 n=1 Tax=Candidatus Phytoplasma bonamiae TaxID=2982626 RepID=A0ABT9D3B0_9MOLU|nr:30S ribosomal protein S8 ['Bonamia sp.' little leaf phytoplasma]MDO8063921.1 30S ribosomal protein S8 ['Bonamia sp.' little leaf phytoplasma]MDV3174594.1 30S ribosomal protein S8 ['Bonamia sp.' little leaf phytoplasma]
MVMTDTIADLLTRIRNANVMKYDEVCVPCSNLKIRMLEVLKKEGFITNFIIDKKLKKIFIYLKYNKETKESVIKGLKRVSKYVSVQKIPKVRNGFGIALISTSRGILTDYEASSLNIGGHVLAYIW